MNALSALPKSLLAEPGESTMGLLLRTANANHLEGLRWFYSMLERTYNTQLHKEDISAIASITGQRTDTIEAGLVVATVSNGRLKYIADTQWFSKAYGFRSTAPQVCPLCLSESGFARLLWEFTFVNACPLHCCALLDFCPQCGKSIRWNRLYLNRCNCGMPWDAISPISLAEAHPCLMVSKIVASQLEGFMPSDAQDGAPLGSMLHQVSFDILFQLIWIFGSKGSGHSQSATGQRKTIPSTAEAMMIVEQALERMQIFLDSGIAKHSSFERLVHVPSLMSMAKHISDPHDAYWLYKLLRGLGQKTTFRRRYRIPGVEQLTLF